MNKTASQIAENVLAKVSADDSVFYPRQVLKDITGGRGFDPEYLRGEVDEFLEAYENEDIPGIDEELQDVLFGTQMLAHQRTDRDTPIYGADDKIREFYRRNAYLDKLFKDRGLEFNPDYTVEGSNPKKPHKIQRAFELAGHELDPAEAQRYSQEYDQFKGASDYDLASLAPKWTEQDHLRIALKEHLADAQGALGADSEAKELMDLALITQAYRNAHVPKELQEERWKKFLSTAKYPSLAAE